MKKTILALVIGASIMMVSCGGGETEKELSTTTVTGDGAGTPGTEGPNWELDESSVRVQWTGFKLEAKAGVSGVFDSVTVSNLTASSDAATAITGAAFEIQTQSIFSKDSLRDWKLANILFGGMETPVISGEIKSVADGRAIVAVTMGGATADLDMSCEISDAGEVKLMGGITDLQAWSDLAGTGFDALAEACAEKHEGVTHKDVEIIVWANLTQAAE